MRIDDILPGFKSIEYAEGPSLFFNAPGYLSEGSRVEAGGKFTELPSASLIECQTSSETVYEETLYTTVLSFLMKDNPQARPLLCELTQKECCFRVTDVYGQKYLLGTGRRPFPIVKPSFQSGGKGSETRAFTVEIRYVHTHSLLCLI